MKYAKLYLCIALMAAMLRYTGWDAAGRTHRLGSAV